MPIPYITIPYFGSVDVIRTSNTYHKLGNTLPYKTLKDYFHNSLFTLYFCIFTGDLKCVEMVYLK